MKSAIKFALCAVSLGLSCIAAAESNYQVVTVTDGGTISGTVRWSGAMPHRTTVAITKDVPVCDPESHKTRDLERLIVGEQGGVANTVVFLKEISAGKAFDLPESRRFLNQKECRYEPHILLVPQGETLRMKSSDATLHTVHMDGAATYNLPFPFPNQVITREMTNSGLVNVRCSGGHVWMNAEMMVVPHPYFAVTDESGNFTLTEVPRGEYEIAAWHEGWHLMREEQAFDVLTGRKISRPVFSEPVVSEKHVSVWQNGTATVNFSLSEK